jgi:heme a synthase
MTRYRGLVLAALALAFVVVVFGAYVRLSDAGLGCPDWPLCYGRAMPEPMSDAAAHAKAWKEMGHRYLAGALGLLIFGIALSAWGARSDRALAATIALLVIFQATLGMWTVTLLLRPAVVTAHLLGGMATLALLVWLALRQWPHAAQPASRALRGPAALALLVVAAQIGLGGWVSANYAAPACPDLPGCRGQLVPPMDFVNGFHVLRELGRTGAGGLLSLEALTAIHWAHRVLALAALGAVAFASLRAWRLGVLGAPAAAAAALVLVQFALGIANVAAGLPLGLAAAHNAGAAFLLAALVVLNFFSFRGMRPGW